MKKLRGVIPATVAALAMVLTACSGSDNPTTDGTQGAGNELADDCTPVVVGTSSEKVNLMEDLGAKFKDSPEASALDGCATVYAINVPSGSGSEIISASPSEWPGLSDQAFAPTIWSPASTVWTDRVAASGAGGFIGEAESFTRTPVVFGIPESMADALGYPEDPISMTELEELIVSEEGWGAVGKPLWGSFKVAKTNPNTSTTGLSVIVMQSYAHSGKADDLTAADVAAAEDFNRTFESGAIHYGDTTGNVLRTLAENASGGDGSSYVSAVALEETSLFNYNIGNPDSHTVQPGETLTPPNEKLVAVYPEEGSMWSDNPATVLNGSWVTPAQKAASEAFVNFLQTEPAQSTLPQYGFRPVDDSVDVSAHLNAEVGIDPNMPTVTLPKPEPSVVSAALDQWTEVRKPSAVLQLIDISGSMNDSAGNGNSKLESAITSVQATLGNFRPTDKVGIWAFTTDITSEYGDGVVPVREFDALSGDREALTNSVGDLRNAKKNGTPLYDAIEASYDYMTPLAEPGRINAIVVLSDGADTDSSTSLDSLMVKINSANTEGGDNASVRIFTIAYGEGANKETLERIAKASGGQMFDATDPTRISQVLQSVMNNF